MQFVQCEHYSSVVSIANTRAGFWDGLEAFSFNSIDKNFSWQLSAASQHWCAISSTSSPPWGTISVSISLVISISIRLTVTIRISLAYINFSAPTEHLITSKQCVISPARIIPADHQLNPPQAPSTISLVTDYTRVVRFPHQPDPWQLRNHNFHLIAQLCCSIR